MMETVYMVDDVRLEIKKLNLDIAKKWDKEIQPIIKEKYSTLRCYL